MTPSELVQAHLHLVYAVARKFWVDCCRRVDYGELVSIGTVGLCQSAQRYRAGGEASFVSFAYPRIRGAIADGMMDLGHLPRRSIRYNKRHGIEMVHQSYADLLPGSDPGPQESAICNQHCRQVRELIANLPPSYRQLIEDIYWNDTTIDRAGATQKLSRSWASRLHARILDMLRAELSQLAA